jgi:hypothetical protein
MLFLNCGQIRDQKTFAAGKSVIIERCAFNAAVAYQLPGDSGIIKA